ncbi:MAG: hypothetical protein KGJ59_12090 [Bacteroidota bacterium]|nr:hypothetical protein [Bacteroidota bacterium]
MRRSNDFLPPVSWQRANAYQTWRYSNERHASAGKDQRLINANLKSGNIEISATDWMASPQYEPIQGTTFAIFVIGQAYEELKTIFDKLAQEASKDRFQDLHDMPFGTYGQFYDRFGVHWIFKGDKKVVI